VYARTIAAAPSDTISVLDRGEAIAFSFADLMKYHGPGSPGGVAQAFKVLQRALPLLAPDGPPERREIALRTSFGGPGARDGFEYVTRAVSEDRYAVDAGLERHDLPRTRARFVFRVTYRDRAATLTLREGFVTEEFMDALAHDDRTPKQEADLTRLKGELADRVMAASAEEVYEAVTEG